MSGLPPEIGDLLAVDADDLLLDRIAHGVAVPDPDELAGLLGSLRDALHSSDTPLPALDVPPAPESDEEQRRAARRRTRARGGRVSRRVAVAASAVSVVVSLGGVAAAYPASPGAPLWGLHKVVVIVFGGDSAAGLVRAQDAVAQAQRAVAAAQIVGSVSMQQRVEIAELIGAAGADIRDVTDSNAANSMRKTLRRLEHELAALPDARAGSSPSHRTAPHRAPASPTGGAPTATPTSGATTPATTSPPPVVVVPPPSPQPSDTGATSPSPSIDPSGSASDSPTPDPSASSSAGDPSASDSPTPGDGGHGQNMTSTPPAPTPSGSVVSETPSASPQPSS